MVFQSLFKMKLCAAVRLQAVMEAAAYSQLRVISKKAVLIFILWQIERGIFLEAFQLQSS